MDLNRRQLMGAFSGFVMGLPHGLVSADLLPQRWFLDEDTRDALDRGESTSLVLDAAAGDFEKRFVGHRAASVDFTAELSLDEPHPDPVWPPCAYAGIMSDTEARWPYADFMITADPWQIGHLALSYRTVMEPELKYVSKRIASFPGSKLQVRLEFDAALGTMTATINESMKVVREIPFDIVYPYVMVSSCKSTLMARHHVLAPSPDRDDPRPRIG